MNANRYSKGAAVVAAAALLVSTGVARAALYGNLTGPNVSYTNINETDLQIAGPPVVNSTPTGLFGAPVLFPPTSDNLMFPSLTFGVLVADGEFEEQDGKLTMDLSPASSGVSIHSLLFDEGGAWRVLGPDAAETPSTASMAQATLVFGDVRITALDGVNLPSAIIVSPTFAETVNIQTGTIDNSVSNGDVTIKSAGGEGVGTWDITASFNFDAALAAVGDAGDRITGIEVGLDNQLFAQTSNLEDSLTLASIDKKHFDITPTSTTTGNPNLPEPTANLLLVGAAGLLLRRRRMA